MGTIVDTSKSVLYRMADTFLYFGYGSNLLRHRILIQNPTAQFIATAKLNNYQLDFNHASSRWKGAVATITECQGKDVWGVVWRLNSSDMQNLDEQEGVHTGIYKPVQIQVDTGGGECLSCRSYQLLKSSTDKRPSPHYLDVIIRGAVQNALPEDYITQLRSIETNTYTGDVPLYEQVIKQ